MDSQSLSTYLARYPFREIMDDAGNPTGNVMTGPVRLAFCKLATPRENLDQKTGQKVLSWGCVLLIPKAADITALKTVAGRAAAEKFGANWRSMNLRNPIRPQDDNAGKYDGYEAGAFFLDVSSRFVVPIVGAKRGADGQFPRLDPANGDLVYSGMWALASLNVYTYDVPGNRGVKFGLRALQKLADDDEFKGSDAASAFGDIDDSGVVKHGANGAVAAAKAPAAADLAW